MFPPAINAEQVLDEPLSLQGPLILENARTPGEKIDVAKQFGGQVVFIRGICPECPSWNPRKGKGGLGVYRKLFEDYGKRVAFVGVRNDFGHFKDLPPYRDRTTGYTGSERRDYARRLQDATAYARDTELPGLYLVNPDSLDLHVAVGMRAQEKTPPPAAHAGGYWGIGIILDQQGRIVYRHGHSPALSPFEATIRRVFETLLE